MRILMLNYEFPPLGGGAANATYYMLKEFSKLKNIKIDLITSSKGKFETQKFSDNIRIYKLNVDKKDIHYWRGEEILSWTIKAYFYSRKLLKKNNYDICHCWFGWPSGIIGVMNKKKVPYVVGLRGSDVPGYNPRLKNIDKVFFKPLSKYIWKKAKAVTANSLGLKKLALKTLKKDIKIIYNGVDTDEFCPLNVRKKSSNVRLISTGRLIKRKGYDYLIKALKGLDYKLILIGEGDEEVSLKKLSKSLKVDVDFKGALDHSQIVKELNKADVFVLPSLNEGMSNSILEGMAVGLPILATDVGGTKELVDESNGFVVKKRSVKELREVLVGDLGDLGDFSKLGKESRKKALKMNWKAVVDEYVELY